jgi:hypothetical protein
MMMNVEQLVEWELAGETEVLGENLLQCHYFFPLALQPNSGLGRLHEISVSLQLLDLGQSIGLLGRVISSSQGPYLYTNT